MCFNIRNYNITNAPGGCSCLSKWFVRADIRPQNSSGVALNSAKNKLIRQSRHSLPFVSKSYKKNINIGYRIAVMFRLYIVYFLFLCLCASTLNAQVVISKLGVREGLSNETVRSIFQDSKGFMWFGTLDGLNRFDGYDFKTYHNVFGDSSSLLSNVIYGVTEDRNGNIWMATRLGVCRLNRLHDRFTTVYYKKQGALQSVRLDREVIKTITCDRFNNILIASELKGLMICGNASTTAIQVPLTGSRNTSLYHYGVQALCFDRYGRTLVFVQDKGLYVLDYKSNTLKLLNAGLRYVNGMLADGDKIWMATNDGLYCYSLDSNGITSVFNTDNGKIQSNLVIALASDNKRYIYVATMGAGLYIYDNATGKMERISGGDSKTDLTSSGIYSLFVDDGARVWLGTRRGGINIVDKGRRQFQTISHEPGNKKGLSGNFITSVAESPGGTLFVATEENGLNVKEPGADYFNTYQFKPGDVNSISSNNVNNITIDHNGSIWLATYTDGICRFDPSARKFKRYIAINPQKNQENKVFNTLYEDRSGTLWASALRRGNHFGALYQYNRSADKFEIFDDRLSDLFSLLEDSQGNFWGGGLTDLVKINKKTQQHEYFYIGQFIRTITDDGLGNLWLGTEGGGLVLFDRNKKKIKARYTVAEGLSNNSIFSTLQDNNGHLWLGTFNGLSRFDISSRKFKNFYRSDGLQSDQFHFNAATKLKSGAFVFGGIGGYNVFYPDSIHFSRQNAHLRLTAIIVDGKKLENTPDYIVDASNGTANAIAVPYDHAVFSFSFAALEYAVPNKISYAYYMDGWDKGWNYSGQARTATYTHLSEGRYVFRVKSTNGDGKWVEEIAMPVRVYPPWYRSIWAYLLYLSAFVSLFYLYIKYRARQAKLLYEVTLQKLEVQNQKAERDRAAAELALEKSEHERYAAELASERTQRALERSEREAEKAIADKEKEVDERRAAFFTNISHEFRTPLSLIINPIKDVLDKDGILPEKEERELKIVYRNAKRMLSLTNQLLMFRRDESGMDRIYPQQLNLSELCNDVYLCFIYQARQKELSYELIKQETPVYIHGDREKLEIVFYNLLSNALKYAPYGGQVYFTLNESSETVTVGVSDNGPGIQSSAQLKIFDKFYQARGLDNEVQPGFGIGLYLAKQFTNLHGGNIEYRNNVSGGSLFLVELRKGMNHFSNEQFGQIATSSTEKISLLETLNEETKEMDRAPMLSEVSKPTEHVVAPDKQSILVVDDDETIREYLALLFSPMYQVYQAVNGDQGFELAERIFPDIIISDIMMGHTNGINLCSQIKQNPALGHIPVILLTGTTNETIKLEGVREGADDYIMKPFDKDLLLARVESLLKNRNNIQRYFYNEITLHNQDAKIPEQYRQFLETCIKVVEDHLDDEQFSSKKLASELGMSYSSITKKVKTISGQSLNSFIRFIRLRKAARLFIDTNYNVNEVASLVGIYDARYFREQFSRQFNMNPSDFIKKYRNSFSNKFTVNRDILNQ